MSIELLKAAATVFVLILIVLTSDCFCPKLMFIKEKFDAYSL